MAVAGTIAIATTKLSRFVVAGTVPNFPVQVPTERSGLSVSGAVGSLPSMAPLLYPQVQVVLGSQDLW